MGVTSELLSIATTIQYGSTTLPPVPIASTLIMSMSIIPVATVTSNILTPSSSILAAITATSTASPDQPDTDNGECQLLGPFAIFVQAALGGLALLSLVYKRWRERPQRPLKIWGFDVSKQVIGSVLLHLANLLMSMLSSGQLSVAASNGYKANPCSFYLLNLAIDTTLGIPILILLLRLLTIGFCLTPLGSPPESIQSGNYGQPPKTAWWLKQCLIYFIGLLGMKLCVFFIFRICPWIVHVGDWALKWTEGNEMVQVFFVMLFFPVIMNAIQYYIIDGFIKNQKPQNHEAIPSEDEDSTDDEVRNQTGRQHQEDWDASFESEDEVAVSKRTSQHNSNPSAPRKHKTSKVNAKKIDEYDSDADRESSPTVVGSTSHSPPKEEEEEALLGEPGKESGKRNK